MRDIANVAPRARTFLTIEATGSEINPGGAVVTAAGA